MKHKLLMTISLLLCAVLFVGCSVTGVNITNPTGSGSLTPQPSKLPEGVIMTVNGQESDYREVLLYLLAAKEEAELLYGEGVWDFVLDEKGTTYGKRRKEQILQEFIDLKIVISHAGEFNIGVDEDENQDIASYTAEFVENVGTDRLVANGISTETIKKTYFNNLLATKVYEVISLSVDTNVSDSEAFQSTYQYIFKSKYKTNDDGEKILLDETALEQLKTKMKTLLDTGKTKTNFLSYAQLNTDAESAEMTIGTNDIEASLYQVISTLADNEFSPILEGEDGYYIFKCIKAFDEDATMAKKEEILAKRQQAKFDSTFAAWKSQAAIVINSQKWESLNP